MNNSWVRVISAIVMITILAVVLYLGHKTVLVALGVVGLLVIDEIYANILKKKRVSLHYLFSHLLFLLPFVFFNFVESSSVFYNVFVNASALLNVLLLVYLFAVPMTSEILKKYMDLFPFLAGVYMLLPLMSLASFLVYSSWISILVVLFLISFGMDSGAWFVGKNLGRHKLWPSVSPNKTVEGLLGGMFTAGLLASLAWGMLFKDFRWEYFPMFTFLGGLSQLGDLIQSKFKRQYEVKDTSALIPGHGGIYDRVDSLVYLAPFFAIMVRYALSN